MAKTRIRLGWGPGKPPGAALLPSGIGCIATTPPLRVSPEGKGAEEVWAMAAAAVAVKSRKARKKGMVTISANGLLKNRRSA
jgi:hypothetical protein